MCVRRERTQGRDALKPPLLTQHSTRGTIGEVRKKVILRQRLWTKDFAKTDP